MLPNYIEIIRIFHMFVRVTQLFRSAENEGKPIN